MLCFICIAIAIAGHYSYTHNVYHFNITGMPMYRSKEIPKVTVVLILVIAGIVNWKLPSIFLSLITITVLIIIGLLLTFDPKLIINRAASIITTINSIVKRAAASIATTKKHVKPSYVVIAIFSSLWLVSSVFGGIKIKIIGLCVGGVMIVYYIKPYNSRLTLQEIYRQMYPAVVISVVTIVSFTFMMLALMDSNSKSDWESFTELIIIFTVICCICSLCYLMFILLDDYCVVVHQCHLNDLM